MLLRGTMALNRGTNSNQLLRECCLRNVEVVVPTHVAYEVGGRLTPVSGRCTPEWSTPGWGTPAGSPIHVRKGRLHTEDEDWMQRYLDQQDQDNNNCTTDLKKQQESDGGPLYPNCDTSIWLRTCTKEVLEPLDGNITGNIPSWLKGTLLRNGPGCLKVGDMTFSHLFDSSALLHRFGIADGKVTYQCRFLRSRTYQRNMAAQRIVVTEFGTKAVPDPCQTIFQRVAALFTPGESLSDNAMISVYPFGDEFYTFTESPIIHRIDPKTLETLDRVNVYQHVGVVNHTSHPHVLEDGTVHNLGLSVGATGPYYTILRFPSEKDMHPFKDASVVGYVPARWPFHPSYMHTFGLTESYFVIVEQPLSVSVPSMVCTTIFNEPMAPSLKWYPEESTQIHLINRKDGKLFKTFTAEAFFYLHIINAYEKDDHVVIDICCYRDASMLDCMYIEAMKEMQKNPDYARMFRGRPLRFIMPLKDIPKDALLAENLVTLQEAHGASAHLLPDGRIFVCPELLCDLGCETPRINYDKFLGKPYRYFYAISSDVDAENPGTLIKVDIEGRTRKTWCEENVYPSEPIFVPSPNPQSEDDGIVLAALVWGQGIENKVGMLVLDGITMQELGRATFNTPGPVPKCLHGWFTGAVV